MGKMSSKEILSCVKSMSIFKSLGVNIIRGRNDVVRERRYWCEDGKCMGDVGPYLYETARCDSGY